MLKQSSHMATVNTIVSIKANIKKLKELKLFLNETLTTCTGPTRHKYIKSTLAKPPLELPFLILRKDQIFVIHCYN